MKEEKGHTHHQDKWAHYHPPTPSQYLLTRRAPNKSRYSSRQYNYQRGLQRSLRLFYCRRYRRSVQDLWLMAGLFRGVVHVSHLCELKVSYPGVVLGGEAAGV